MEAKDLMIGDFVTFKDCLNDDEKVIVKIWQINGDNEAFVSINSNDVLDEIEINDEIAGIPLTPEILDKFGPSDNVKLDGCENFREWFIKGNNRSVIVFEEKPRENYLVGGISIHYVHELQHFLRLCGIEKEIEL